MNHTLLKPMVEATSLLAGRIRAIWGILREFAPYAAIELILPGGTILAILYWLYRRRRIASGFDAHAGVEDLNRLGQLVSGAEPAP